MTKVTTFTEQYSQDDQVKVNKILAEINARGIRQNLAGVEFSCQTAKLILAGEAQFQIQPKLNHMFEELFGEGVKADDIASDNSTYTDKYSKEDIALCEKIQLRMNGEYAKQNGLTGKSIASAIKINPGVFSQLINGKYKASPSEKLTQIWNLIKPEKVVQEANVKQEPIVLRYGDVEHVPTKVSTLIAHTCNHAFEKRRFSVFVGQPGVGKSFGLKAYVKQHEEKCIYIEGDELTCNHAIINELSRKLGLPRRGGIKDKQDRLIAVLKQQERIIILDEADKCKDSAIDPLRTISERAFIGVTLVGNLDLADKIKTTPRFELIHSRVCFWTQPVGELPVEDIKTLFETLTKGTLKVSDNTAEFWRWLHKRVNGNARLLVENVLPHIIKYITANPEQEVNQVLVNGVFANVLNEAAM